MASNTMADRDRDTALLQIFVVNLEQVQTWFFLLADCNLNTVDADRRGKKCSVLQFIVQILSFFL